MSTPVAPGSPSKSSMSLQPKYVPPHRRGIASEVAVAFPPECGKPSAANRRPEGGKPSAPNQRPEAGAPPANGIPKSKLIGYYSVDRDRKFLNDASKMMYYTPSDDMKVYIGEDRDVDLDLDEGADVAVRRDVTFLEEGISLLLKWILQNHEKIKPSPTSEMWIRPKFVTTHGTMIKLLSSGRLRDEPWIICAAKWRGSIYLCADKESKKCEINDDYAMKYGSWGHKFEQYILSKTPGELPDTSKPVIEPEEFRCVFQRSFGGHIVIYCAVMKGLLSRTPKEEPLSLDSLEFVELKTNRTIEFAQQETRFRRRKLLKWWAHCCLTNTEYVLCGFRDDFGIVNKLSLFNVDMIRESGERYWKAGGCVNYCASFLAKVEQTVRRDCDESIYKFEKTSDGEIQISELPASSKYTFLPSWFLEESG